MKKAGAIILVIALCLTTVISYGDILKLKKSTAPSNVVKAESIEDIKAALEKVRNGDGSNKNGLLIMNDLNSTDEAESLQLYGGFSNTNVQIEGIDEADAIKTDGEYLYIAAEQSVYIVKLKGEGNDDMELIAKLNIDEFSYAGNIFIDENRLIVLGTRYIPEPKANDRVVGGVIYDGDISEMKMIPDTSVAKSVADCDVGLIYMNEKPQAFVKIYDTSDISDPKLIQDFAVDGSFETARKTGNFIYVVSNKYVNPGVNLEKATGADILPAFADTNVSEGEEKLMPVEDIYICPVNESAAFTTLAVLDVNGSMPAKLQSYMGSVNEMYMNSGSVFLTFSEYKWDVEESRTNIVALDISGMNVECRAEGSVPGTLLNQFSMDEYNGYFRIATTPFNRNEGSSVFVLDEKLNKVGSIDNIAEGEQIYSVRFMGDRGYVVTFETMDPFFTLDLSDPKDPHILGELKLPGYSSYLHQLDENTVLGIGRDTQEIYVKNPDGTEEVIGYREGGIKLSVFDVSDFSNPKETGNLIIGSSCANSEALYNHKTVLVDRGNMLIGFAINDYDGNYDSYSAVKNGAYVFDLSGDEIVIKGIMESIANDNDYIASDEWNPIRGIERLIYAGDSYYYLEEGVLRSFDRASFSQTGRLNLI